MEDLFGDLDQIRLELEAGAQEDETNDESVHTAAEVPNEDTKAEERAQRISIRLSSRYDIGISIPKTRLDYWTPKLYRLPEIGSRTFSPIRMLYEYVQKGPKELSYAERRDRLLRDQTIPFRLRRLATSVEGRLGAEALDRKLPVLPKFYLLVDVTLCSGINTMSFAQIRSKYGGIAWKYLGRQAYKEFRMKVKPILWSVAKSMFIHNERILVYLRLGYIQWLLDAGKIGEEVYLVEEEAGAENDGIIGYLQKSTTRYRK